MTASWIGASATARRNARISADISKASSKAHTRNPYPEAATSAAHERCHQPQAVPCGRPSVHARDLSRAPASARTAPTSRARSAASLEGGEVRRDRRRNRIKQTADRDAETKSRQAWAARRSRLAKLVPSSASDDELLAALGALGLVVKRPATAEDFGGGFTGRVATLVPSRVWVNPGSGRAVTDPAALWQAAYDQADAQVAEYGGTSRPKRVTSRRRDA
jgi:hypothetical protein